MADYLGRLVVRASGHPVTAPPVRPLAPPRNTTADDGVDDIVHVLPSPAPPVETPRHAVADSRPTHEPRAGSPPGVEPRPVAVPDDAPPVPREPPRRPTPEPAMETPTSETVRRPVAPLRLRQEPVPRVTPPAPPTSATAARPTLPAPPAPAVSVPTTIERPSTRREEPRRPAPRDAASAPVLRLTPPAPAASREPLPPAPQLHIGSIHVEVMPTPPRATPAPRPVAPVVEGSALTGSSLLGQRFGLGQL